MKQTIYVIREGNEYFSSITNTHIFWAGLFAEAKIFNNKDIIQKFKKENKIGGDIYSIAIEPILVNPKDKPKSIYEIYIPITSQKQSNRLKAICLKYKLPIWDDKEAFKHLPVHLIVAFIYNPESKEFYVINPYNGIKWFEENNKTESTESEFIALLENNTENKIMNQIEKLSKYGLVITCKIIDNSIVTIVLTEGFSQSSTHTLNFMKDCLNLFPEFPIMETCITENSLAIVVLKREKK